MSQAAGITQPSRASFFLAYFSMTHPIAYCELIRISCARVIADARSDFATAVSRPSLPIVSVVTAEPDMHRNNQVNYRRDDDRAHSGKCIQQIVCDHFSDTCSAARANQLSPQTCDT